MHLLLPPLRVFLISLRSRAHGFVPPCSVFVVLQICWSDTTPRSRSPRPRNRSNRACPSSLSRRTAIAPRLPSMLLQRSRWPVQPPHQQVSIRWICLEWLAAVSLCVFGLCALDLRVRVGRCLERYTRSGRGFAFALFFSPSCEVDCCTSSVTTLL